MRTVKMSENLHWQNLSNKFFIGEVKVKGKIVKVNELQEAIEDGTLLAMIKEAADAFYEGDVSAVLLRLKKNLSNWKCVAKMPTTIDKIRFQLLWDYCESLLPEYKRVSGKARPHDASAIYVNNVRKPQWAYNAEDLAKIDDVDRVVAIIHSIADVCAGKGNPERNRQWLGEDYLIKAVENREAAYKRRDELLNKQKATEIKQALADKLAAFGSDKVFTAEELMALLKG